MHLFPILFIFTHELMRIGSSMIFCREQGSLVCPFSRLRCGDDPALHAPLLLDDRAPELRRRDPAADVQSLTFVDYLQWKDRLLKSTDWWTQNYMAFSSHVVDSSYQPKSLTLLKGSQRFFARLQPSYLRSDWPLLLLWTTSYYVMSPSSDY